MNIIDVQDQLKDFSEQQLIREMQIPSGTAPQFLVLSEIQRRKRMRDDFAKREAAQQKTVAQEAVAAAGVPQAGIAGMSEAMAPKSTMAQNGIGSVMPQAMRQPQAATPMAEGGVVKMSVGGLFDAQGRPTEALLRALIAQESGGDPTARGSLDEVGISQIRPSTALMPGYGVTSMFPEIAAKIGEGKEYATVGEAYLANKELIDAGLEDPERSTAFTSDYLTAMRSRFDDDDRALAAYNIGPGGAAGLEDPSKFGYVADVRSRLGDEPGVIDQIMTNLAGAADAVGEAIVPSVEAATLGPETTDVKTPQEIFDQMQEDRESQSFSDQASRFFQYPLEVFGMPVDDGAPGVPNTFFGGDDVNPEANRLAEKPGERAAYEQELRDQEADKATEASQMYQDYIARGIASGVPPSQLDTPREYREKRIRPDSLDAPESQLDRQLLTPSLGDAPGMTGVVSEIQAQEAAADAITQMTEEGEDPAAATQAADQAYAAGQRMAEQRGERAEYEASLRDGDDLGTAPTAPPSSGGATPPVTGGAGTKQPDSNVTLFGGEAAPQSSIEAEIAKLKGQLEKDRNTDKWLALAQAGMALMSSKEPTLLGAAGEAGISGLKAFREAQERYQEGIVDLINAEAKLKDKKSTGITAASAVSRLNKIEEMLNPTDATAMPLPPEVRTRLEEEARYLRRNILGYADITA